MLQEAMDYMQADDPLDRLEELAATHKCLHELLVMIAEEHEAHEVWLAYGGDDVDVMTRLYEKWLGARAAWKAKSRECWPLMHASKELPDYPG